MTDKSLEDRIMRIVSEEVRRGAIDTKALRLRVREVARAMGAAPPPPEGQVDWLAQMEAANV